MTPRVKVVTRGKIISTLKYTFTRTRSVGVDLVCGEDLSKFDKYFVFWLGF